MASLSPRKRLRRQNAPMSYWSAQTARVCDWLICEKLSEYDAIEMGPHGELDGEVAIGRGVDVLMPGGKHSRT